MLNKCVKIPLSVSMKIFCVMFSVFAMIIAYGTVFLLINEIVYEDGEPLPMLLKIIMAVILSIAEASILFMIISLWKRIINGNAMTVTHKGIEDTFVVFTVLCFWTTFKIRCIPWNAMIFNDEYETITLDFKLIPENSYLKFVKLLLLSGFNYKIGKITYSEIKSYRDTALEP